MHIVCCSAGFSPSFASKGAIVVSFSSIAFELNNIHGRFSSIAIEQTFVDDEHSLKEMYTFLDL